MTAPPGPPGHEQLQSASPARVYLFPSGAEIEGRQARAKRSPHCSSGASERRWLVSNAATHWAWKTAVRGVRQHVLLALADRANKTTRQCAPSLAELSDMTGLGESTIRGHIRALELDGLIKVDVTNGGRRQRSTYTLMIDAVFTGETETPQELGGIEPKTRQQRGGKKPETPQLLRGIEAETPQELAGNPPAAGGVVLRTKTSTREPVTTGEAVASPSGGEIALFSAPSSSAVVPAEMTGRNKLAQVITASYQQRVPLSKFVAVLGIVRKALNTGLYSGEEVHAAVMRLAEQGRQITIDTLRIELEGFAPTSQPRRSTTDQRTSQAQSLKARFPGGGAA